MGVNGCVRDAVSVDAEYCIRSDVFRECVFDVVRPCIRGGEAGVEVCGHQACGFTIGCVGAGASDAAVPGASMAADDAVDRVMEAFVFAESVDFGFNVYRGVRDRDGCSVPGTANVVSVFGEPQDFVFTGLDKIIVVAFEIKVMFL